MLRALLGGCVCMQACYHYLISFFFFHTCREVRQDMLLGTPDAPCSGFMREMQVHIENYAHNVNFPGECMNTMFTHAV